MILSKILRGPKPPSDREDINKFSKTKLFTWKGLKQHPSNLLVATLMAGVMTLITVTAVNAFRSLDLFGNGEKFRKHTSTWVNVKSRDFSVFPEFDSSTPTGRKVGSNGNSPGHPDIDKQEELEMLDV